MKLATYNVNGIRAAIRKGLLEWIDENQFDIIGFQETKSQPDQIDASIFEERGYHAYWHSAEKKGYSGVLTLSKTPAKHVQEGMGNPKFDKEGRVLKTDFDDFSLLNCYFPSGSAGEERHAFKMKFLRAFRPFINDLLTEQGKLLVIGDYNIVHLDIDIHNPQRRDNPSGFRPEERRWLNKWFKNDFDDAFRLMHPDEQEFSWWSYRAGARDKNKGWRIDYISVSKDLSSKVKLAGHQKSAFHSDHCPVVVELKG